MKLNEQTNVTLTIGTVVVLVGSLVSAVVWGTSKLADYEATKESLQNLRNRVWVLEHPTHPWSIKYKENHQDD